MKNLQCAVIGCGRIGCGFDDGIDMVIRTHAGSYYTNSYCNLVALCDIDKSKLEKYGKKYNISGLYTESSKMFKQENIYCVSICTLIDTHLTLVKEAVNAGVKGIFLEKPISDTLSNSKKIIDICKKNNVALIIDHQRRFDPFYHSLKQTLGRIGNLQLVNVLSGSGIANTGSHLFDLIRFLFGELTLVTANFSRNKSSNQFDPNLDIVLTLREHQGTLCKISSLDYSNYALFEMDVIGTTGRIKINLTSNEFNYYSVTNKDSIAYKKLVESDVQIKQSKQSSIQLAVQNLIHSIKTRQEPMCTGYDGYKSLELIIASIISAKKGRPVKIPLTNNSYKISSK